MQETWTLCGSLLFFYHFLRILVWKIGNWRVSAVCKARIIYNQRFDALISLLVWYAAGYRSPIFKQSPTCLVLCTISSVHSSADEGLSRFFEKIASAAKKRNLNNINYNISSYNIMKYALNKICSSWIFNKRRRWTVRLSTRYLYY